MKSVVIDALSGRQIIAGPEETEATQPFVNYLTQKLGWNPRQLMTRPQWRVPRTPSASRSQGFPVDIAIFDSPDTVGDPEHVRILVECKQPNETEGIEQLKSYLGLEPNARLGVWFNGVQHCLVYKTADGFVVNKYAPVPRPRDPLSPTPGRAPLRVADLKPPPNLGEIFSRLRDQIAAQDTHVNRDEFILNDLANLLICKIADEQESELDAERPMAFQRSGSQKSTGQQIKKFFEETRKRLRTVFVDDSDELHLDDGSIDRVVRTLEGYKLTGHDRHAVGQAFQVLRNRALKGDEGAYFTPPPVVDCAISIVDPKHTEKIIDPACGTGGFLAATLDHVFQAIDQKDASLNSKEKHKRNWAQDSLFAIDKDAVSVKLCKAYLTLLGDGRGHAYRANSIDRRSWAERTDALANEVRPGYFDVVVTNPPFGSKLKVAAEIGAISGLKTSRKWKKKGESWVPAEEPIEQQLGVAFFERGMELLKDGGRMAIVLPDTFLFSSKFRWFVDWICRTFTITHLIDIPMVAFEEFCRAKTSVLIVTKRPPPDGWRIVMSYPKSIGQDKNGSPLFSVDDTGRRNGQLDNEMATAVQEILSAEYAGNIKKQKMPVESRLRFSVPQSEVIKRPILVSRYWWRKDTEAALRSWCATHDSELVSLGSLVEQGVIRSYSGHGSPPGHTRKTGSTPYVKVTDLKNWRVIENSTNFIHEDVASELRKNGPRLYAYDLVSPARASANIGQFCMLMPWQTHVVFTREVLILRAEENNNNVDNFLLLALLSLRVVQAQYEALVLMQTNREDLSDRWKEILIPLPKSHDDRRKLAQPVRAYIDSQVQARSSYESLLATYGDDAFGSRP